MHSWLWPPWSHFSNYRHSISSPKYLFNCLILCSHCSVSNLLKFPYQHLNEVLGENEMLWSTVFWNWKAPNKPSFPGPKHMHLYWCTDEETEIKYKQKKTQLQISNTSEILLSSPCDFQILCFDSNINATFLHVKMPINIKHALFLQHQFLPSWEISFSPSPMANWQKSLLSLNKATHQLHSKAPKPAETLLCWQFM